MAVRLCFLTHKIQLSIFVYGSQSLFPYAQDPTLYLCLWQSEFVSLRTGSNSLSLSMAVSLFPYAQDPTLYLCLWQSEFVSLRARSNSLSLSMAVSVFPYAQNPTLYLCLWQSQFVSLRTRSNSLSLSLAVSVFPYARKQTLTAIDKDRELDLVRRETNSHCHRQRERVGSCA
jgi:hypothetical protein